MSSRRWSSLSLFYRLFLIYGLSFLILLVSILSILKEQKAAGSAVRLGVLDFSWFALLLYAGVSLLTIFILHRVVRQVLRPLQILKQQAVAVSQGHFEAAVPLPRADELGELSQTFHKMAQELAQQKHLMKQLIVGLSHELRSPLARMRMTVETLPEGKVREDLIEEIHFIDRLTDDVLTREKLEQGLESLKLQQVEFSSFLEIILDSYGDELEFKLEAPKDSIFVSIDLPRFEMALRNIIENSLRHALGSPVLQVDMSVVDAHVRVVFTDREPGESEVKTAPISSGYGLGLKLTSSILRVHGGEFSFERSSAISGFNETRVAISLPVVARPLQ